MGQISNIQKLYEQLHVKGPHTSKLEDMYKVVVEKKTLAPSSEEYSIYSKPQSGGKYEHIGNIEVGDLPKVKKVINAGRGKNEITPYLNSKNYSDKTFKNPNTFVSLVDELLAEDWVNFIANKSKPLIKQNKIGNLGKIASKFKVNFNNVKRLADFQGTDAGGSNIGPGEILLSVLFADVFNSTSGGDLMLDTGEKIEVKGQKGRFGQQGGRSSQGVAFEVLNNQLKNKIVGVEQESQLPLTLVVFHGQYKKEGKEAQFLKAVQDFCKTFYPEADYETILKDPKMFGNKHTAKKVIEKLYVSNYINKYDFEDLLFLDKSTLNYAMFTPDDLLKKGGYIDTNKIKIDSIRFNNLYPSLEFNFKQI